MKLFLSCVAAALGIGVSKHYGEPPTIERLEVTYQVTRHVASTITVTVGFPSVTLTPTLPAIPTVVSSVPASTRIAAYGSGFTPFDIPAADTRSPISVSSLLYGVGEWASTPINLTPFQVLTALFALSWLVSFAFFYSRLTNRTQVYILRNGAWATARMYNDRFHLNWCRAVGVGLKFAKWLADGPSEEFMMTLQKVVSKWVVAVVHAVGLWIWNLALSSPLRVYNVAIPFALWTWTALLLPSFRFLWKWLLCPILQFARTRTCRLATKVSLELQLQQRLNTIHLYCLSFNTPAYDPYYDLAVQAASTPLTELVLILQQNDALQAQIATLRKDHKQEVDELRRTHERQVENIRRANGFPWQPRTHISAVNDAKYYQSTTSTGGASNGLFYQEQRKRVHWYGKQAA